MTFERMWRDLLPIGRDAATGGYRRSAFTSPERECAAWYVGEASRRGLDVEVDGQGNAVAWWRPDPRGRAASTAELCDAEDGVSELGGDGEPAVARSPGILVGSHLDSVDNGGAYDGPLGVMSSFAAIDRMRERGVVPAKPIGVALFVEEEGSRFGVACLGSRLATGRITPSAAADLRDRDGVFLLDAMSAAGLEPELGRSGLLDDVESFVELHVEQGRDLIRLDRPVAVASSSWAHGRWRFDFTGEPNHAGSTRMEDRHDPMLTYAMTALAANKQARLTRARATFGRLSVEPNATNAIPERVRAWLDARGEDSRRVDTLVEVLTSQARERAIRDGTQVSVTSESVSPTVDFDGDLSRRAAQLIGDAPMISTGAGHDAGVLQLAGIPSAMLFVRNPTGVSHSPDEFAEMADCLEGVEVLATVLTGLAL